MNTSSDLMIIVAEVASAYFLKVLNNSSHVYGDETHEFRFKTYSPMRVKHHPDRHFICAAYSKSELDMLYSKVDMTYRQEPVDYLMWALGKSPSRTFLATDFEILSKIGEIEFYPFSNLATAKYSPEAENAYLYVLDKIFGEQEKDEEKKNYIVAFSSEGMMLEGLGTLLHPVLVPKEKIKIGKASGIGNTWYWSLALSHISPTTIHKFSSMMEGRYREEVQITEHTLHISPKSHDFQERTNPRGEEMIASHN